MDVHQRNGSSLQYRGPTEIGPSYFAAFFSLEPATNPLSPNWWYRQDATICTNARQILRPPFFLYSPTLTSPSIAPLPVPPLRSSPRFTMLFLFPRMRSRANQAYSAAPRGTPFSHTRTAATGAWPSSRRAESPRSTRRGASVHLVSARLVAKYFGGTTKSFGTSTLVDRTRDPERSLRHMHATFAISDSRGETL